MIEKPESTEQKTMPEEKSRKMSELLDKMTSRLAFRMGFFVGMFVLAGVLFSFLFLSYTLNNGKLPGQQIADSDTAPIAADAQGALGEGEVPPPYEDVLGDVELTKKDHVRGSRDADIVLIEYSDFECPFCKRFHSDGTLLDVIEANGGESSVAWAYRHFPLSFHEGAHEAAQASECVAELAGEDAFWVFTDEYYERTVSNGNGYAREEWGDLAKESGVKNVSAFEKCVDSERYAEKVDEDLDIATELGVTGTPGTIVLNQKTGEAKLVGGAYPAEAFQEVIDLLTE